MHDTFLQKLHFRIDEIVSKILFQAKNYNLTSLEFNDITKLA